MPTRSGTSVKPGYSCVTNQDCPGYHTSKHDICDERVDLLARLTHIEHDMALQGNTRYAETIGEAVRRLERLEKRSA